MNNYDHEDAFKDANLCAGRKTNLATALKTAQSELQAKMIIEHAQTVYQSLFDAFLEGVDYGRRNPRSME